MNIGTLRISLVVLAGVIVVFWLLFALLGSRKREEPNAMVVLRYGSVLQMAALVFALVPPTLLACVTWRSPWVYERQLFVVVASFLGTCVIGGLLLIEVVRTQIVLAENGITRFSPWMGKATLSWAEVESVRYSAVNRWFIVRGTNTSIRVSRHLVGIRQFAATIKSKVAQEHWASAAKVLDSL